jgi:hypothetical protein
MKSPPEEKIRLMSAMFYGGVMFSRGDMNARMGVVVTRRSVQMITRERFMTLRSRACSEKRQ